MEERKTPISMTDTVVQVESSDQTPVVDQRNINMKMTNGKKRRLSQWFVNNQKEDGWDEETLNTLHTETLLFAFCCVLMSHNQ